jgi:hypothetical protein
MHRYVPTRAIIGNIYGSKPLNGKEMFKIELKLNIIIEISLVVDK